MSKFSNAWMLAHHTSTNDAPVQHGKRFQQNAMVITLRSTPQHVMYAVQIGRIGAT